MIRFCKVCILIIKSQASEERLVIGSGGDVRPILSGGRENNELASSNSLYLSENWTNFYAFL